MFERRGMTLPEPDSVALQHSMQLVRLIRDDIVAHGGKLRFSRFMEQALYAPGLGYYRGGAHKFGSAGDFVTAPEISSVFSRCLARQIQQILADCGSNVLELGAGSGAMAADLLLELEALGRLPQQYLILELSGELRQRQQQTLSSCAAHLAARVTWLEQLPEAFEGVIVGNEVMDAIPVERFRITPQGPRPLAVSWAKQGFAWCEDEQDSDLDAAVADIQEALQHPLPLDYESEWSPLLPSWLASLGQILACGVILLIDYGYPRREYYHPQRCDGTLICHYCHRNHDDPLRWPGLQDISASVDFSAAAAAGIAAGLTLSGYTSQSYFLFGCGLEALIAQVDPNDQYQYLLLSQQVKQLTLPGEMGERCKALALSRGLSVPLRGFDFFDERQRL